MVKVGQLKHLGKVCDCRSVMGRQLHSSAKSDMSSKKDTPHHAQALNVVKVLPRDELL